MAQGMPIDGPDRKIMRVFDRVRGKDGLCRSVSGVCGVVERYRGRHRRARGCIWLVEKKVTYAAICATSG